MFLKNNRFCEMFVYILLQQNPVVVSGNRGEEGDGTVEGL
jgi:hypothetical protein